jgi:pyruvate ferredoxin oxidoreductase gamma subunit
MYRIRFHGRGGQGMKTASRILGTAFFREGFEVQDAPRYGAERRGAPIFAFVRAARRPIYERGIIHNPDLVVVADDSLVPMPTAGVLQGLAGDTVLLINSHEDQAIWHQRLNVTCPVVILPATEKVVDRAELRYTGAICAGAAARLVGVISRDALANALEDELKGLGPEVVRKNQDMALEAFDLMGDQAGAVSEGDEIKAEAYCSPDWVELPFEMARISAPAIHAGATSVEVRTGLWRTMRPVIDYEHCNRCWWVCGGFCPDGAINLNAEGYPEIDYDHCKGCLICVAQCPPHAIAAIPELEARDKEHKEREA